MSSASPIESILKRDRLVVLTALTALTALSWVYLVLMAVAMDDMPSSMSQAVSAAGIRQWSAMDFLMMFLMWAIMMVGMMLPSATPMILLFALFNRKQREQDRPYVPTALFLTGYLFIWTVFSLAATILQWTLDQAAMLSPMMVNTSPSFGALLLIIAGVYQLTPFKNVCLKHCRTPQAFVRDHWRNGRGGAVWMGIYHGAFCLGCCWFLMGLLFVGGVMNLIWIAAIAIFVLIEKVAPYGTRVAKIAGLMLILFGLYALVIG